MTRGKGLVILILITALLMGCSNRFIPSSEQPFVMSGLSGYTVISLSYDGLFDSKSKSPNNVQIIREMYPAMQAIYCVKGAYLIFLKDE